MVLHVCEKCNRSFNKKSSYNTHINRKFPCSPPSTKIDKLEEEVKILNVKIQELESQISEMQLNQKKLFKFIESLEIKQ